MSQRLALVLVSAMFLCAALCGTALADETDTKQVGLVIAFPDGGRHTEVVTVPAAATTFDVLNATGIELVSQTTSVGTAICGINRVGCPADNCFCDPKQFWAYYHLNGDVWTAAAEGAGSYVPAHGAVEGFAWSGFDASFNPTVQPPILTFAQIAAASQPTTSAPPPAAGAALSSYAAYGLLAATLVGAGVWVLDRKKKAAAVAAGAGRKS